MKLFLCRKCGKELENKRWLGTWHLCITDCEYAGTHLDVRTRRRGPLWRRRTETYCAKCLRVDK